MNIPPWSPDALLRSRDFETAGRQLLEAMFAVLRDALAGDDDAELLRGFVHLRPGEGYRGMVVWPPQPDAVQAVIASATAWSALRQQAAPIWVDVEMGRFTPQGGATWQEPPRGEGFADTRQRMLARDTTHFGAVPLALPHGGLLGMVTLELRAADATGLDEFAPWREAAPGLMRLARIGALVLDRCPPKAPDAHGAPEGLLLPPPSLAGGFANAEAPILLTGESGTGKTRLARWCHDRSPRAKGPFVVADLQAVSPNLREALLFGVAKGAFTGAEVSEGCVARAEGGTLFIDEVADLSPEAQLALFRLLDDGGYRKVGESRDRRANVRVISATNQNLQAAIARGHFREELLYRINTLPLELQPLREQLNHLPAAAEKLLREIHYRRAKNHHAQLSTAAMLRLSTHGWPGNLRELKAALERAYILACHRAPMQQRRFPTEVILDGRDVDEALRQSSGAPAGLIAGLRGAARAMLAEAERRVRSKEPPLELDHADAFKGVLVAAALQVRPDPKQAAELLGIAHRERGRYLRSMRIAAQKTEALCALLGEPVPPELAALDERNQASKASST